MSLRSIGLWSPSLHYTLHLFVPRRPALSGAVGKTSFLCFIIISKGPELTTEERGTLHYGLMQLRLCDVNLIRSLVLCTTDKLWFQYKIWQFITGLICAYLYDCQYENRGMHSAGFCAVERVDDGIADITCMLQWRFTVTQQRWQ